MVIEEGLCKCGCGLPTRKLTQTDKRRGLVKGQYSQYLPGHNPRTNKMSDDERRQKAREQSLKHYHSLTTERKQAIVERNELRRQENMRRIYEYLLAHPCVDCGETDPIVLEFDHVRGEKKDGVVNLACYGWKTVEIEIAKCDVRCANCHKRKTRKQLGWRNYMEANDASN